MDKIIPTDLKSHNDVMETMREGFDSQDEPGVGIFWYNTEEKELFGVNKAFVDELIFTGNGYKTIRTLHRSFWKKEHHKAKAKGQDNSVYLRPDYTQIPRGRIFQREIDNAFEIRAGKWIEEDKEAIKKLIIEEFSLENENVEIIYDNHWDIGHGWSEDDCFG